MCLCLDRFQQATVHNWNNNAADLNTQDAHMPQWIHLPPEAWVHIITLICLTEGLWLLDIFLRVSVQHQQLPHTYFMLLLPCHLNCDECSKPTGFSYTIEIKPLHVLAVGETLRCAGSTGVMLTESSHSQLSAWCCLGVGDNMIAKVCQCDRSTMGLLLLSVQHSSLVFYFFFFSLFRSFSVH